MIHLTANAAFATNMMMCMHDGPPGMVGAV
jgi:hypothetical protein